MSDSDRMDFISTWMLTENKGQRDEITNFEKYA